MKRSLQIMILAILAIFVMGCSSSSPTGKSVDDMMPEPTIDKSYDTKVGTPEPTPEPEPKPAPEPKVVELTDSQKEAKAKNSATMYVKNLDGYKSFDGRGFAITSVVGRDCDGCYIVDARFERDDPLDREKTDIVKVHLDLEDFKVDKYTFE